MKKIKYIIVLSIILLSGACTDLDEVLYDKLSADTFFQNEEEIKAGVANVYRGMFNATHLWYTIQLQEITTDHAEVPTRTNGGWYDGGSYILATTHTWDATYNVCNTIYGTIYRNIASTNYLLETLEIAQESFENLEQAISEVRAIRAYHYLQLCDLFGNVPLVTVAKLDQQNLPTNNSRKEIFDFVEAELLEAIEFLPSGNEINRSEYYPRITKEAAWAILAKLYLNAEVYSGTARWQDCIDACDQVINSGVYQLTPSIWDSFVPENHNSPEIILAISLHNENGPYNDINQRGLHPLLKEKYDLPYVPWGGIRVGKDHYKIYDDDDFRKSLILSGDQYSSSGEFLFTILPLQSIYNADPDEGLISIKYKPDQQQIGISARNDNVLLRYADILLSKAEALFRTGETTESLNLVNQVRARNFSPEKPLTELTLDKILEERSREFLWECKYRTDLIRFGKFLSSTYQFKPEPTTESFRTIFPIPQSQIQSNPNLEQNPGY
jgi:tetratricopeptide (TPR) repeat protein